MSATLDERGSLQRDLFDAAMSLLSSAKTRETLLRASPDDAFPDAAWRAIVDAGWGTTLLAEEHGGLGLGAVEAGALFRAVGRGLCRGPLYDLVVSLPLLANDGAETTRGRLIEAVHGRTLVVTAEAPPPPYGEGERAVSLRGGRLVGTVELVPFGASADRCVVVAHDGSDPVLVLVDPSALGRERTVSHDPCVERARVTLDGVPVERADVIASGEPARRLRARIVAMQRLMVAAELSGVAAAITDMAVEYAKVREQFGRPIAGFQAVRHMLARMTQRTVTLTNLADASLVDADADADRLDEIAAIAKSYATQTARWIAEEALQVHGGIGFTAEYPLHLYMRRALTLESLTGESSALVLDIGHATLE